MYLTQFTSTVSWPTELKITSCWKSSVRRALRADANFLLVAQPDLVYAVRLGIVVVCPRILNYKTAAPLNAHA